MDINKTIFDENVVKHKDKIRRKYIVNEIVKLNKIYKINSILDLGCNQGYLIKEIKDYIKDLMIVGVDQYNYNLQTNFIFIKDNIINFVNNTNVYFDLTLCIWIIEHLKNNEISDKFFLNLSCMSKYLLTFTNDNLINYNLVDKLLWCELKLINEKDIKIGNTYKLRLFEKI
jgi:hypothetical protein